MLLTPHAPRPPPPPFPFAAPQVDLRPGGILPTIEYSVAWLEWVFRKDPQAFALLWGDDGIVLDDRFVQPVSRAATDS